MKIYHELYGFYFLFGILCITLVVLTVLLFVIKAQKKKNMEASSDDYVEMINEGEEFFAFNHEKSNQGNSFINEDNLIIDCEVLFEEIIDFPDSKLNSSAVKELNNEKLKDNVGKTIDRYAKEEEYQGRYQMIKEKLRYKEIYSIAYDGLLAKATRIEKALLLFRQMINSEFDAEKIDIVVSVLEELLREIEEDIAALPILIELSHMIIPRKINEISNEYKKLKYNGIVVDDAVPGILKEMSSALANCLAKIKSIDLDGVLEQMIDIAKSLDGVNLQNR
jgi:Negative regulator of septation ring formation